MLPTVNRTYYLSPPYYYYIPYRLLTAPPLYAVPALLKWTKLRNPY